MHNDLILNWIPVYIKVTKIDSVRFDHTGIKSFFFKFQFSVIFYNFIFFPPFLYFFFICFFEFSDLFMETFVKPVFCLVFQPYIFPNIQKSLLILKQQIRIFPGLQFVGLFMPLFEFELFLLSVQAPDLSKSINTIHVSLHFSFTAVFCLFVAVSTKNVKDKEEEIK